METRTGKRGPTLSLCMIVRDEEELLRRCLDSVEGVVDEIIVVDTGSQDSTISIATAYGATVLHHDWGNDFSAARNAGLDRTTGDWILVLDADEELETESRSAIKRLLVKAAADGFQMTQRSLMPPGDLQRYEDIPLTRLFRNCPLYRYEQPIHEQIRPAIERSGGRVLESDLTILHYGYAKRTVQGKDQRGLRNLELLKAALAASPEDPYLHFQLGVTYKAIGDRAAARSALLKALTLDYRSLGNPMVDKLYMKLAQLALASDDLGKAVQYAKESLARNANNVISLYVMALAYLFQGDVDRAYPCFKRLKQLPNAGLSQREELDTVIEYCRAARVGNAG